MGYDFLDVAKFAEEGVLCSNIPPAASAAVADMAMALLLAAARDVCSGLTFYSLLSPSIFSDLKNVFGALALLGTHVKCMCKGNLLAPCWLFHTVESALLTI